MRSARSVALVDEVRALVGARILDFSRVHVVLATGELWLEESLVVSAEERAAGWWQFETDGYEPFVRRMAGRDDYAILGEYSDRKRDSLKAVENPWTPFLVDHILAVWHETVGAADESLLALVFCAPDGIAASILFDNDDVLLVSSEKVWRYMTTVLSHPSTVGARVEVLREGQTSSQAGP
ncbi:MAG: hypothetical protein K1X94_31150 [Sandaracinaceae bacterium]|nr:hypothetical protein [Sandaracinaceae bacterium]